MELFDIINDILAEDDDFIDDSIYTLGEAILKDGYCVMDDFDPNNDVKKTFAVHSAVFDALKEFSFPFVPSGKINAERLEAWYGFKDENDDRLVYVFDYPRYNMGDKLLAVIKSPSDIMEGWDSEDQTYYGYDCGSVLMVAWVERANA